MNFPYNTTLPNPPDDPADDVSGMQVNTLSIAQLIAVDHVGFNKSNIIENGGFHNQVTFQLAQAAPTFAPGVATLAATTAQGQAWPFWRNNAAGGPFQIIGPTIVGTNGYMILNNGLVVQWGQATSVGTSLPNATVTLPFTLASAVFSVNCTILTTAESRFFVELFDLSTNQFRAVTRDSGGSKTGGITFCWMAIGK